MVMCRLLALFTIWLEVFHFRVAGDVNCDRNSGDVVVHKKSISTTLRLLFSLGIEGAGHHYIGAAIDRMFETNYDLLPLIRCDLSHPYDLREWAMGEAKYVCDIDRARADMKDLADMADTLPFAGGLVTMQGCGPEGWQSWLSYPNFPGPDKPMQYMDLRMLAEVAEAENVDLRIVYLKRSAKEVILSTTKHRHFQRTNRKWKTHGGTPQKDFERYIRILLTDIGVVHSLLAELGPGFVVCHDYSFLGNRSQAERIANFVAPTSTMATAFVESLVETASVNSGSEELESMREQVLAERLQLKFDVFESALCRIEQ